MDGPVNCHSTPRHVNKQLWTNANVCLSNGFSVFNLQVLDILVVNQNYNGDNSANSLTLRRGDLVEVLDQTSAADKDPSAK